MNFNIEFVQIECANCNQSFAITHSLWKKRRRDHGDFYCPDGHTNYYPQKSDLDRVKEDLERSRQTTKFYQDLAAERRRSMSYLKGQITKTKNKLVKGNCPECDEHFEDLAKHIQCKHPEFMPEPDVSTKTLPTKQTRKKEKV